MPAEIRVVAMRQAINFANSITINPCSNSTEDWQSDLSPFIVGPCDLGGGDVAKNMENAWQYSKVYAEHADADGNPTAAWRQWAKDGWNNPRAVRYPMGRGAKPLYSFWYNEKLGYIDARKKIYGNLYANAIFNRPGFKKLQELYKSHQGIIVLRDFDGYDEVSKGMTLTQVLNEPKRKMGHAFVIKMLLLNDPALTQIEGVLKIRWELQKGIKT